jgi:hypothetical protein
MHLRPSNRTPASSRLPLASAAVAILGLLGLPGCASEKPADLGVTSVQFEDVRVPTSMKLVSTTGRSHSNQAGAEYRYGDFGYEGRTPVEECAEYLSDTMPQHRWQLVSDQGLGAPTDPRILRFERGVYEATYTIERIGSNTRMQVQLRTNPAPNR